MTTIKINKSEVMKKAWEIFKNCRGMFPTFSLALERAWKVVKANVKYRLEQAKEAEMKASYERGKKLNVPFGMVTDSISSYYENGAYSGD